MDEIHVDLSTPIREKRLHRVALGAHSSIMRGLLKMLKSWTDTTHPYYKDLKAFIKEQEARGE